ncbi:MAG: ATP-binding protein, partial [Chloroflexi bacterium]|nr:ATP-binding protein [Chloroflexota bacterium]
MALDLGILETLLHEDEGTSLDFKSKQYLFEGASKTEKAELLKDILAFANSWRRTTAYILIGVEEVKGGRSKVVGVNKHLDDAKLHQFVNSKTQRQVVFAYRIIRIDDSEVGVIEIPIQERPIYLKGQFDKLERDIVYVRDGSSTRAATPDEIARMAIQGVQEATPQFMLEWANLETNTVLPSPCILRTLALYPCLPEDTFSLPRPKSLLSSIQNAPNPRYSQEVIDCTFERSFFAGLGLRIFNNSSVVGRRIRFEGSVCKSEGFLIRKWLEDPPRKYRILYSGMTGDLNRYNSLPSVDLQEFDDRWEIGIDFGDFRPQ